MGYGSTFGNHPLQLLSNDQLKTIRVPDLGNIAYPSYTVGRPDSVTFPGGSQQTFEYDTLLRLNTINASASGLNYQYTYDNESNILTKSTEHGSYAYGYDDVSRLLTADNPTLDDEAWTYDGVGNRQTASDITGTITHSENNELMLYGDVYYGYDDNGNLIHKQVGTAATNYTYDAANRLIRVEDELSHTIIAEYGYDPFRRRLWKDVSGTRTYFLYADEGVVAEYDASGKELRSYGYQPDSTWGTNPLWLKQGNTYYWYQNDHLGTPQKLIDMAGNVVWTARYDAFGNAHVDAETVVNNLRFPGQYFDAETGLHYNWFRYYEPESGRYTQTDPIGFAGGDVNLYGYAGNNPEKASDPFGLLWTITREGSAQAEAVACNDTIDELAKIIGLAAEEYQKWLEPAYYSGPRFLPSSSSETIPYQKFYIPNIIYAYWGGNLMGFGRWAINWNASISYLRKLGFQVLEIRHERGDQLRMNRDITYLLQQKTIHGVYYAGHGSERGLFTGNKWRTLRKVKGKRIGIPVGFVDFGDPGDEVLNYWEIRGSTDDYYHLAFGLIFACFSDHGGYPLVGYYPRPGAIWQGDDNIFWVTLEPGMNGPYYDPDADVPEPFHVEHWIRPGDQGTQPNGGWQ